MIYHVQNFGAKADGVTNDAAAIQAAIDACSAAGGGRVVLESGKTYYASSIVLKPGVDLHLERGSLLKAHEDIHTYLHPNEGQKDDGIEHIGTPVTLKPSYAFIYAKDADNIAISGPGTIDGNAYAFVKRVSPYYVTGDFYPRPTLIYVEHCNHISFTEVVLQNAPFWTLHPAGCDDVLISQIRILNDLDVANSDGIDPDHSTNVRIIGCHVTCADDCICLKSSAGNMEYGPTKNVIISNCTLISTSAALKIGTEGTGNFENVLVDNCIISGSNRGISIQIRDGGNVSNVSFSNIIIETRRFADCWWGCAEPITITTHDRDEHTKSGHISNIRFSNITCDSENGVFFSGSVGNEIEDVWMEKVQVTMRAKTKWPRGLYDLRPGLNRGGSGSDSTTVSAAEGLCAGIEKMASPGFFLRDVKGVTLRDCRVRFEGDDLSDFGEALRTERCTEVSVENFRGKAARPGLADQVIE
ncbi:glycoside hydrolase family 28 protein [Agathobaculum sp. Marseille-P7918]|uniref:glycoside hydrolase family 28 protein n=1 Tax=Agathobaculum sp. Marseille-P7918 TaxID=2479843 RepID=UPI00356AA122